MLGTPPKTTFNLMLGTRDDGTRTCRMEVWCGSQFMPLYTNEEIQSFTLACREAINYLEDVGQQCNAHMTPSTAPTVFTSYQEELDEIASIKAQMEKK